MEKFKDPPMMVSSASMIGVLGATYYFYKQNEVLKQDIADLTNTIAGVIRRLSELEKEDQNKMEAFVSMNDQLKLLNTKVTAMPSIENIELMSDEVSEIMEVLSENNIITEKRNRRQQNQLNNRQNFSYESSNTRYDRLPSTNREGNSFRNQQKYNVLQNKEKEEQPKTQNKQPKVNYEDDYALIQEVRLNTQTGSN